MAAGPTATAAAGGHAGSLESLGDVQGGEGLKGLGDVLGVSVAPVDVRPSAGPVDRWRDWADDSGSASEYADTSGTSASAMIGEPNIEGSGFQQVNGSGDAPRSCTGGLAGRRHATMGICVEHVIGGRDLALGLVAVWFTESRLIVCDNIFIVSMCNANTFLHAENTQAMRA